MKAIINKVSNWDNKNPIDINDIEDIKKIQADYGNHPLIIKFEYDKYFYKEEHDLRITVYDDYME